MISDDYPKNQSNRSENRLVSLSVLDKFCFLL